MCASGVGSLHRWNSCGSCPSPASPDCSEWLRAGSVCPVYAQGCSVCSGLAVCACVCSGLNLCALCVFRAALCAQGCSMCPGCSYGWLCMPWLCSEMLCVPVSGSVPGQAQGSHAPVLCVCLGRFVLLGKPTLPVLCSLSLLAAASQDVSAHQGSQTLP